ncbi:hypothetical protein NDU88_001537 [Pleurodeles waltl]|uniref:Uncharacterized protein n=1 Tax=Pleurodeles waltl TaxID=8319 RepID=A0AAV7U9N0_PLEWA|nr:hypothetical protein NDU88_001537 [Pleurodeles waltl]
MACGHGVLQHSSDAYYNLMPVRSHPKDIWGSYQAFLAWTGNAEASGVGKGEMAKEKQAHNRRSRLLEMLDVCTAQYEVLCGGLVNVINWDPVP